MQRSEGVIKDAIMLKGPGLTCKFNTLLSSNFMLIMRYNKTNPLAHYCNYTIWTCAKIKSECNSIFSGTLCKCSWSCSALPKEVGNSTRV